MSLVVVDETSLAVEVVRGVGVRVVGRVREEEMGSVEEVEDVVELRRVEALEVFFGLIVEERVSEVASRGCAEGVWVEELCHIVHFVDNLDLVLGFGVEEGFDDCEHGLEEEVGVEDVDSCDLLGVVVLQFDDEVFGHAEETSVDIPHGDSLAVVDEDNLEAAFVDGSVLDFL